MAGVEPFVRAVMEASGYSGWVIFLPYKAKALQDIGGGALGEVAGGDAVEVFELPEVVVGVAGGGGGVGVVAKGAGALVGEPC